MHAVSCVTDVLECSCKSVPRVTEGVGRDLSSVLPSTISYQAIITSSNFQNAMLCNVNLMKH